MDHSYLEICRSHIVHAAANYGYLPWALTVLHIPAVSIPTTNSTIILQMQYWMDKKLIEWKYESQ